MKQLVTYENGCRRGGLSTQCTVIYQQQASLHIQTMLSTLLYVNTLDGK